MASRLALVVSAALVFAIGCPRSSALDPCGEVDCGGHGVCVEEGSTVACECDPGYHSEGRTCVEDGGDGDAEPSR